MQPKVSVIITTHNRCGLLVNAIQSVKRQTYNNIELIVVDDASTDKTRDICKSIDGIKYINIAKSESNGGNHARNVGIINSTGKYVAFLDDDDEWLPDKIEKQVQIFENDPKLSLVYCNMHVITGHKILDYNVAFNIQGDVLSKHQYWKPICTTSAMMVKKDDLISFGMFDENVRYWQEYEVTLQLIRCGNVALSQDILLNYRRDISDVHRLTNNYSNWVDSVKYINNKHKDILSKLNEYEKRQRREYYYREAAYRCSITEQYDRMRDSYKQAYKVTNKKIYYFLYKTGLSRSKTIIPEIIIKKIIYSTNSKKYK